MSLTPDMMTAEQWRQEAELWKQGQMELHAETDRLTARLAEVEAENERLRPLVGSAFREGHAAGYSCACAKVERPDSHGDWLVSRIRAALAQTKESRDDG